MEDNVKKTLCADTIDKIFSLIYFVVGYLFVYTFTSWDDTFDRKLAIFTVIYAVVVLAYCKKKKIQPTAESYFWLVIMLTIGVPYAFWHVLDALQVIALIFVAAYWTLSIPGRLLLNGRTSQYVFFDGLNALTIVPFTNYDGQFRVLFEKNAEDGEKKENYFLSVLIGVAIVIPALIIILPLLSRADAGFEQMLEGVIEYIFEHMIVTILRIIFAVPVACYLYGLIFGSIRGRNTNIMKCSDLHEAGMSVRKVPNIAIDTAMIVICLIYVIFISLQGKYMFSAFAGTLPAEFTYAEYARRGFFELCQIGAWNIVLLIGMGMFSKTERKENRMLRILSIVLSVLTLLIIATAMSKMVMYIIAYGLTVKRIVTMMFMIWMAIVFLSVIIQQKKEIPLVRVCMMTGAVIFALLCVSPIESWIKLYNGAFFA